MASSRNKTPGPDPTLVQALRNEIQSCLQKEFEIQLKEIRELVRRQFENRLRVRSELDRSIQTLQTVEREIAVMVDDPTVELSQVIHRKTTCSELMAYVRGLTFQLNRDDLEK